MSVGFPLGKNEIDNRAGSLCLQIRDVFAQVKIFNALLVAQQANLLTLPDGAGKTYTQAEVTELLTSFNVLDQLRQVFEGTLAIPNPVNIQSFLLPFVGTN